MFLLPASPFGLNTNTFDIHARQSNLVHLFSGPQAGAFTPSATFLAFVANDSLTGDSYGFLPYNAYGELKSASGGWGEVFLYLTPQLHLHTGYGVDSPLRRTGDTFLLTENQTLYTNLVWNWTKNIQISNQVDFRKTKYRDPLLDAEGVIFYSEFQWKF